MKNYNVVLKSPVSKSFRCQKAADSLDIDTEKKSVHTLNVDADIDSDFNVGLIIGASGSGKTTLAKQIYGDDCFGFEMDPTKPIIEQFPSDFKYEDCVRILNGIGLTSVPCWIRPVFTLSNGQKARAEAALILANGENSIIDEWTSVVDRTVAKAMSHCLQKSARTKNRKIVLLSCHYDVVEWLNPDWIIDCNKESYTDRRLLRQNYERKEKLEFEIRSADRKSWRMFSKYHYLSDKLPGGHNEYYGLFHGDDQIGFQCFSNYVPWKDKHRPKQMHFNRTVVHPDYVGLGLGVLMINETSRMMKERGFKVMGKFSSTPVFKSLTQNTKLWKLKKAERQIKTITAGGNMDRKTGFRQKIKVFSFEYIG
jgi:ABC-type Mn2+/Zn2+ transport system ATPase subunit